MGKKIVLIDGHSILTRAFFGVPPLTNAQGIHTNAVYGFLNIMLKILSEENPDYLMVAFDEHAPTFRHKIYAEYKGTRKPMPSELHEQVPIIKQMLQAMNIMAVSKAGYEADDILGTVAKKSEAEGLAVTLVSGDRDLLQIASDKIKICIPKTKSGKTEVENYYAKDVEALYGVDPVAFIDLKALMGDSSDNIPGVPKVGEKTAKELMAEYKSLDGIYEHLEEISKNAIRESLRENRSLADLSKVLATIDTNADIDFSFEAAKISDFYTEEAYVLCKKLEFKNLLSKFENETSDNACTTSELEIEVISGINEVDTVFANAIHSCETEKTDFGLSVMLDDKNQTSLVAISLYFDNKAYFMPVEGFVGSSYFADKITTLINHQGSVVYICDIKPMYCLYRDDSTDSLSIAFDEHKLVDPLIAAYLINPLKSDFDAEIIAGEYLSLILPDKVKVCGKNSYGKSYDENKDSFIKFTAYRAYTALEAGTVLTGILTDKALDSLFFDIEMPLTRVLYEMEKNGVKIRKDILTEYGNRLGERIDVLSSMIYEKAGTEFNINSPKQLGEILFEKLMISGGKKTKTGYSTAADVLEKLAPDYPIVSDILEYRALTKLKSTYAEGLVTYISEDGRIHSNFNQTITATGRISSTEPNLQNIPIRTELGREIRKVFVPEEGYIFLDADYSQIELRLLAHLSEDKQLIDSYKSDADIHRITASKVFCIPLDEVTPLQRRNAKAVNFGIVYGISSFGLSQDINISRAEAKDYIEQYFKTYPGIKAYLDGCVDRAKEDGYVTTMYGRIRPIPELKSSNFMQRSFGERVAMNSPIQGTAADIMKIAMINVYRELKRRNLKSRIILQVHDELLIETLKEEADEVAIVLTEGMKHAADLAVTLEVDLNSGSNWYDAH